MRKLILTSVMAIAMATTITTTASAAVEISNPGSVDFAATLILDVPSNPSAQRYCDQSTLTGSVSATGSVFLADIDYASAGGTMDFLCGQLEDCEQAGAEGQIVGPGDEGYIPQLGYDYLLRFDNWCIEDPYGWPLAQDFLIVGIDAEESESWTVPTQHLDGGPWTISGALANNGSQLGITSVE